jgi:hypothetical protein
MHPCAQQLWLDRAKLAWSLLRLAVATGLTGTLSLAQSASEYQVKAAYLYNFAKLAEWPPQVLPADGTLTICVLGGGEDFVNVLRTVLAGKAINEHPLAIKYVRSGRDAKSCHLVFFRGSEAETHSAISELEGSPVLMVGENADFLASGGMINLALKDGKIAYETNADAFSRGSMRFGASPTAGARSAGGPSAGEGRGVKTRVEPEYPRLAKTLSLTGVVLLKVTVRADGSVKDVEIAGGHPVLAGTSVEAFKEVALRGRSTRDRGDGKD